jgi:glycosyltransferase involved in cell wall biosynthesis
MKILAYGHSALATPFGTPSATRGWCEALARTGAEVTLVADAGTRVVAQPAGVRCIRLPHHLSKFWGGRLRSPKGIGRLIGESDVVVIHGAWRPSNVITATLARRRAVPYIAVPHGLYDPHIVARHRALRRAWWMLAERRYLQRAAAVHLFFRDEPRAYPFRSRLIVAPNGMSPPPDVRWDGGSSGQVVWLGRFDVQHKGLDLLIEAIECVSASRRPQVRLIGHDWFNQKAVLRRRILERGLESWIEIEEPVVGDEKWKVLSTARAFVYPSRWEAFGLAAAEAVSIGVPTIVTPFPLGRFLASQGAAFEVVARPGAIADAVSSVPAAGFDAEIGPRVMREHFSWDTTAASWLQQVGALLAAGVGTDLP